MQKEERATAVILEELKNGDDDVVDRISDDLIDNKFPIEMANFIASKGMTPSKLSTYCKFSKSYLNQLLQPPRKGEAYKKHPNKYVIVEMCLHLGATLAETNRLLKLAGCQELYAKKQVDCIIIHGMMKGRTPEEIINRLEEKGINVFE